MARSNRNGKHLTIEEKSRGATYQHASGFTVYALDTYPRHSVLAGQQRRVFVDHYETLAEAQAAHPTAKVSGSSYRAPDLSHLPDDGDY